MNIFLHKSQILLLVGVCAALLYTPSAWAAGSGGAVEHPDSVKLSFCFRQGDALLLLDYRENNAAFDSLSRLMNSADSSSRISSIRIVGSSSPEGGSIFNEHLAQRRAEAIRGYLLWKYASIPQDRITLSTCDDCFLRAVEKDLNIPRRESVLEILRTSSSMETKWANIQLLTGGAAAYIEEHLFPWLRNAVSCVITFDASDVNIASIEIEEEPEFVSVPDTTASNVDVKPTETSQQEVVYTEAVFTATTTTTIRKPLFALKTNLLFDAATMLNLELEVPIGKHFSIAGEWIFPWWLWEKKQHCLQVMSGNIEGKYWFGNRTNREQLTGWFVGLYAGGGYYDLEWNRTGYQGEFFIATGISGGYAHTINKSGTLRMEYSLGVGYMQTNYRKYEAKIGADNDWHLYRRESGTYSWFGPTRARVSLVWMIHGKKRGGFSR